MKLKITYTKRFSKHYLNLNNKEKELFKEKLDTFIKNPRHPSLRTKKIQGSDGLWEFSVNMDIRVIWFKENNELVILVDIGHHDILNKF